MELCDPGTSPVRPRGRFVVGRNGIPCHGEDRARPRITQRRLVSSASVTLRGDPCSVSESHWAVEPR
jgi:hypothetical protein